jgi:Na+-driven multidrug efflux pump
MGFSFEMIFTANGWGRFVLFSEFSTNMVFILGVTFLLIRVLGFGIYAAWTGFALYQAGHAIILTIGYLSKRWIHIEVEKGR